MVNAWSLAASVLDGTLDEDYPIMTKAETTITPQESDEYDPPKAKPEPVTSLESEDIDPKLDVFNVPNGLEFHDPTHYVDGHGDIHLATSKDDFKVDTNEYDQEHSPYYYDYTRNDPDRPDPFTDAFDHMMETDSSDGYPSAFTTFSVNDDQIAHHIGLNNEGQIKEIMSDSRNKYHEKEILKDVEDYVSRTYNGHYTGTKHEYRNVQTIDLMASRDLASDFCQANILKYGSRYGSKDGRNKGDLLKVIHYAMLLLHFDEHYGKPSMTSGNIDHNMP